jgi:hypothetical protein
VFCGYVLIFSKRVLVRSGSTFPERASGALCDVFECELFSRVTLLLQSGGSNTRSFGFQGICLAPPNITAFQELVSNDASFEHTCINVFQSDYFTPDNSLSDIFHDFIVFFYYSVSVMTTSGNGFA